MSPDRWARVSDLFDRAADLDPADRPAFLDGHAVGPDGRPDPALREEVERLLAFDAQAEGDGWSAPSARPPEAGPWELAEVVGRGGMGEVWRASRPIGDGGLRQTAAVKLVRPGLGDEVAARFRAERRILAGLDHPAIARFLDGGRASDGRPYLATEFVDGEPITDYCDRRRLGVNERLALFVGVCEAVAFAHARLVVHRDLKPSNVLVTDAGGTGGGPAVKLLDFGIAKLLADDGGLHTRTGRPLLTPAYAAPEQVAGGAVTTATDVYGLGVLLYELLAGHRPPPGGDATRPSDAVTTAGETGGRVPPDPARPAPPAADTGALRSTTADRLRRRLRGDLDQIVLKALRADPERRYRGAAELGDDLQRHLDGLPVRARPESAAYRVGKFVRRNRAAVAAAAVALLAVVGGAGAALWQARVASAERDQAEAVTDFLESLLAGADPGSESVGGASGFTVREFLGIAAERVDGDFADQPNVRARLHYLIGNVYMALTLFDDADRHLSAALATYRGLGAGRSPEAGEVLTDLGETAYSRGDAGLAQERFGEAVEILRAALPPDNLDLATALSRYGSFLWFVQGDMEAAEPYLREASDIARLVDPTPRDGARDTKVALAINGYANLLHRRGDYGEAVGLYDDALRASRAALRANPRAGRQHYAVILSNAADLSRFMGRLDEAEAREREAIRLHRQAQSEGFDLALSHAKLARTLSLQGRYAAADSLFGVALPMAERTAPPGSPYVVLMRLNRLGNRREAGRLDESRAELEVVAPLLDAAFPPGHPVRADLLLEQSAHDLAAGDAAGAEASARRALSILDESGNTRDIRAARVQVQLGASLDAQGSPEAAEVLRDARRLLLDLQGPAGPEVRRVEGLQRAVQSRG